jgi:hypothetical protein
MAIAFLLYSVLDPYIRTFASGSQPHSNHRYFIDPRPNTLGHLWLDFAFSRCGTVAGADSRLQRAVSVAEILHSVSSNAVSGGAFQGVTPSFHSLEYQLGKSLFSRCFYLVAGLFPRRVYMQQRIATLSNGARRAAQEISIDFVVLPETNCQGLFHHINLTSFCNILLILSLIVSLLVLLK